uniref:Uncharacterized protein n=1 Tax=Solanum tuberosum TaxID=4113 RepID=M1DAU5_SOLTU
MRKPFRISPFTVYESPATAGDSTPQRLRLSGRHVALAGSGCENLDAFVSRPDAARAAAPGRGKLAPERDRRDKIMVRLDQEPSE